jgi:malonyl-CoA O-methyltransferase
MKNETFQNFNTAAKTYDSVAHIQKVSAHYLVSLLNNHFPSGFFNASSTILDAGTGTGFVTEALYKLYPQAHFTLNDIAPEMLVEARKKLDYVPSLKIVQGDAEKFRFSDKPFDLIASNFAFQWFEDVDKGIRNLLKQTRFLAFSTLAEDTFSQIYPACQVAPMPADLLKYPSCETLIKNINNLNARMIYKDQKSFSISFSNLQEFSDYIKNLGARLSYARLNMPTLRKIVQTIKEEEKLTLSYNVFYAILENDNGNVLK